MEETPVLEVKNLVKRFGSIVAVDDVSFSIRKGICFGLLGPNGAGKTTTIEMVEDIITPTSGEIYFQGQKWSSAFLEKIGIQLQHTTLFDYLSVKEILVTFQKMYYNSAELDTLIDICNLEEILEKRNDKLSGGQKQRLMLALALVNDPALIILDEPSTGLDPQARRNLWEIILSIRDKGKTIILTTHYMEEAQFLCDEIVIMDQGKVIEDGQPEKVIKKYFQGGAISLPTDNLPKDLKRLNIDFRQIGGKIEIPTDNIKESIKTLMDADIQLEEMTVRSANLEDVFIKLTGRKLRE